MVDAGSMRSDIAIIATPVNRYSCDYRLFNDFAISAITPPMEVIDGKWIKSRLSGKRGEQTRLAKYLNISTDKLTKTLAGNRNVQPSEVPLLLEFFNENVPLNQDDQLDIYQQIGRLNTTGQRILRKQLDALLESPEFLRQNENTETDD